MNRRQALSLLAALPLAARVSAQTRSTAKHRVALGRWGLLIEPGGTLQSWSANGSTGDSVPAEEVLGLGHNRPVDLFTLYPIPNLTGIVTAAVGSAAAYAVLANGQVLSWGAGGYGVLGTTPLDEFETRAQPRMRSNTPLPVAVKFDAVDVSSKGEHVLALARDGSVYAWGRGDAGQLGIGPMPVVNYKTRSARAENFMPLPVRIPGLTDVVAISTGDMHSLALLKDGTVRAWGQNRFGQVGDGTTINRDTPTPVPGVRNVVAIAALAYSSVAVLSDGTAMDWGNTQGSSDPQPVPAAVVGARGLRSVVGGGAHVVALTQTGGVMTWGTSGHYETGRGRNASAPGLVKELTDVVSIAASPWASAAVLASGRIMTWSEVRPWHRPGYNGLNNLSPFPILLWLDGLEQP
jgi:alpha-tubulin suppressor-like RCC1 family protein